MARHLRPDVSSPTPGLQPCRHVDIFLIRHAESANNAIWDGDADRFYAQRQADPPLTALGRRQAELLAACLAVGGIGPLDEVRTSPMLRAVETAVSIVTALVVAHIVDADVHENGGLFTGPPGVEATGHAGLTRLEIRALLPDAVIDSRIAADGWWDGGHEGEEARARRCRHAADRLRADASERPDARIAIVTHGGFSSRLIGDLLGIVGRTASFHLHNTAITHVELGGERPILHRHNDYGHLRGTSAFPPYLMA